MVNLKRSLGLGAAVLTVALASGHLVQTLSGGATVPGPAPAPAGSLKLSSSSVVSVSSGPLAEPAAPLMPAPMPELVRLPDPVFAPPALTPALTPAPAPAADAALAAAPAAGTDACANSLALAELPGGLVGVTLLSKCSPDERIVLQHAGLAVTARTTATGAHFSTLPALSPDAEVSVLFEDGTRLSARIAVPSAAGLRRFAVQWQAEDALALNAFENGAVFYGAAGHVFARAPGQPSDGAAQGGFLTALGDAGVDLPLLAEVYTFPATGKADIVIEAAVTEATCGREILGEMLQSDGETVAIEDLTLAMPDCSAVGDYLVLKNPGSDVKIAAVR